MIRTLLVSKDRNIFSIVETMLSENQFQIKWCDTANSALSILKNKTIDLLITEEALPDMTGKSFIENIIQNYPMINCAVASPQTKKKFHQTYEGLGVLMQLAVMPGRKESRDLMTRFARIWPLKNINNFRRT